jgi:hypothetical protein
VFAHAVLFGVCGERTGIMCCLASDERIAIRAGALRATGIIGFYARFARCRERLGDLELAIAGRSQDEKLFNAIIEEQTPFIALEVHRLAPMLEPWTAIVLFDVGIGRRTDELARLTVVGVEHANEAIATPNADAVAAHHDLGAKAWQAIVHEHGRERTLQGLRTGASRVQRAPIMDPALDVQRGAARAHERGRTEALLDARRQLRVHNSSVSRVEIVEGGYELRAHDVTLHIEDPAHLTTL